MFGFGGLLCINVSFAVTNNKQRDAGETGERILCNLQPGVLLLILSGSGAKEAILLSASIKDVHFNFALSI